MIIDVGDRVDAVRGNHAGRRGTVVAPGVGGPDWYRVLLDGDPEGNWIALHLIELEKVSLLEVIAEAANG